MKQYLKNSGFGVLQIIVSIGLVFFSIPVFIHENGMKMYGVFAIVSIFGNLTLLFNLGLNTTLLKFISSDHSLETQNKHVTASLLILGTITVFFTILILLMQNLIIGDFLQIDSAIRAEVVITFRIFLVANLFIMVGQPFVALIQAHSDFFITNMLQLMYNIINWGLIIVFCKLHYSFKILSLPALISAITWFSFLLFFALKKYKFWPIKVVNNQINLLPIIKEQLSYSMQVYINSLFSFANEPLLKLVVVKYLGPQSVASLDIMLRIKAQIMSLLQKVFEPMSAIIASKKTELDLKNIVHYSEQLATLIFIPISALLFAFADPFLKLWLHDISNEMIFEIKMVIIIFSLNVLVAPNYYYLVFHGKIKDCMRIQAAVVCFSLLSFFIFKNILMEQTPAICVCVGGAASFLVNLYYQWKYLKSIIFDISNIKTVVILLILIILFIFLNYVKLTYLNYIVILLILGFSIGNIIKLNKSGLLKI